MDLKTLFAIGGILYGIYGSITMFSTGNPKAGVGAILIGLGGATLYAGGPFIVFLIFVVIGGFLTFDKN